MSGFTFPAMRTGFTDFQMLSPKRKIPNSSHRVQIGSVESGHLSFSTVPPTSASVSISQSEQAAKKVSPVDMTLDTEAGVRKRDGILLPHL